MLGGTLILWVARDMVRGCHLNKLRFLVPFLHFFILKIRLPDSVNLDFFVCLISSLDSNELD